MPLPPGVRPDRWPDRDHRQAVSAEIAFHLAARVEELMAQGVAEPEARARALEQFGPPAAITADCITAQKTVADRVERVGRRRNWSLDLRHAGRGLIRSPGFAAVAVAALALGIGATTAVFTLVDGMMLKALPFQHADRLVRVWEENTREGRRLGQLTVADARDLAAESRRFDGFATFRWSETALSGADGEVAQVTAAQVTAGFFDLLGVRPHAGRTFLPGEDRPGAPAIAVVSYQLWRDRFGADPALVGKPIRVASDQRVVVGILPADFINPVGDRVDLWIPSDQEATARNEPRARRFHFLAGIARLAPGQSLEAGQAELRSLGDDLARRYPASNLGHRPYAVTLKAAGIVRVESTLYLVMAAVICLLLITCANLANLVYARTLARGREFAVRLALGGSRLRIGRQVLVEQLILAAIGGVLGLLIASGFVGWGRGALVDLLPRLERVSVDGRAFGLTAGIAVLTAVISGLVPALLAIGTDAGLSLRGSARATLSPAAARGRAGLVLGQVALATLLLVGAGLTAKSLERLTLVDVGFRPDHVLTFRTPLPAARYPDPAAWAAFHTGLLERIRTLPGVTLAAASYAVPMTNRSTTSLSVEGAAPATGPTADVGYNAADGDYFRTLGIPVVAGRTFDTRDRADAPPVIVVNQAAADRYFDGKSPLGRRVRSGPDSNSPWLEVVGVVGNIRRDGRAVPPVPELYYPLSQDPSPQPSFAVRISGAAADVMARIRAEVRAMDREVPIAGAASLNDVVGRTISQSRAVAVVVSGFAVVALLLSAIGIYGVIAFLVAERRREIAVRVAIGASPAAVMAETAGRGLRPVLTGLGVGVAAALAISGLLRSFLFEVSPNELTVYLGVAGAVLLTGIAGVLVPAIRSARIPPATALRSE